MWESSGKCSVTLGIFHQWPRVLKKPNLGVHWKASWWHGSNIIQVGELVGVVGMEDADFREKWKYKGIAKKILGLAEVLNFLELQD